MYVSSVCHGGAHSRIFSRDSAWCIPTARDIRKIVQQRYTLYMLKQVTPCDGVSFTLCHRCISGCLLTHEVAAWVSFARPLTHLCMAASNQRLEERGRFRPGGPTKSDTTRPGAVRAPLIASQRARALQTSPSRAAHAPRVRVTVAVSPKHLPQLKAISA